MYWAGEELKGVMDHVDSEFWGYEKVGGRYDVINWNQRKKTLFST